MGMKIRKWVLLGLWILSLIGISVYGGAVSYGFFFAFTLIPVVSFVYLMCVYFRFKIYQEVESRDVVCRQAMPYYFILRNEDYFGYASVRVKMFPDFSYVEGVSHEAEYELLPGDEFTYRTNIVCKYRGEYEVGVKEVEIVDFFGIFRFRYRILGTIKAIVHAKPVELEQLLATEQMSAVLQRDSKKEKLEPDVVVRDYVTGDSLRRIHWKASARVSKLMVRNDTGNEKQGIVMFFDTKRYSDKMEQYLPLESKMLEVLLSVGLFFAKSNQIFHVYCGQNGIWSSTVGNMNHFEEFYNRTSSVMFDKDENVQVLLQKLQDSTRLSEARLIIGICHELSDELLYWAKELTAGGSMLLLYAVTEENVEHYVRQSTVRIRIVAISPYEELEGVIS